MSEEDRREHERISAKIEVRFTQADQAAKALRGYSLNLSAGGLCLRTKREYTVGAALNLAMSVGGQAYELKGAVAWVRKGVAIGVRFVALSNDDRERLERLLAQLKAKPEQGP